MSIGSLLVDAILCVALATAAFVVGMQMPWLLAPAVVLCVAILALRASKGDNDKESQ